MTDKSKQVVAEILKEIHIRMRALELVSCSFKDGGGLETIHIRKEAAVAYAILDCLDDYISDTWDHDEVPFIDITGKVFE